MPASIGRNWGKTRFSLNLALKRLTSEPSLGYDLVAEEGREMNDDWDEFRKNAIWMSLRQLTEEAELARKERQRDRRAGMTPEQVLAEDQAQARVTTIAYGCVSIVFAVVAAFVIWFIWDCFF